MKKRLFNVLILCLICVLLMLTGCGNDEDEVVSKNNVEKENKVENTTISNQSTNSVVKEQSNTTNNTANSKADNSSKEYTEAQLCAMALDHYEKTNNYRPGHAASQKNDDGTITIQLYDSFSDHNSTSDWYTVNPKTGKGKNLLEEDIDLSPYAK